MNPGGKVEERVLHTALEMLDSGQRIVATTLVGVEGSAPFEIGAMMLVSEDGAIEVRLPDVADPWSSLGDALHVFGAQSLGVEDHRECVAVHRIGRKDVHLLERAGAQRGRAGSARLHPCL